MFILVFCMYVIIGWKGERKDGWMDGWKDVCMEEQSYVSMSVQSISTKNLLYPTKLAGSAGIQAELGGTDHGSPL